MANHEVMVRIADQRNWWRIAIGLAVAPAISAIVFSFVSPLFAGLPSYGERVFQTFVVVAIFGAYLPTLVLGLPAILVFRHQLRPTIVNCALGGAGVAALPWIILVGFFRPDEADVGGRATVIHGIPTLFGLLEDIQFVGAIAALGLLGGIMFWLLAVFHPRLGAEDGPSALGGG